MWNKKRIREVDQLKGYEFLKLLRKKLGITQEDIAKRLGCTKSTYCKMENGDIPFPLTKARTVSLMINEELATLNLKPMSMETIFFTEVVPNVEQVE